ncbi:hypothetical protein LTR53_019349, partial [Teratosphaeriaceae sp. CCFEE 6253]
MAKVPHGDIATELTGLSSLVGSAHRPARLRPQNHVRARLSPACAVTTLSQPVMAAISASAFFAPLAFCQIAWLPGRAPMPPSRFKEHAIA